MKSFLVTTGSTEFLSSLVHQTALSGSLTVHPFCFTQNGMFSVNFHVDVNSSSFRSITLGNDDKLIPGFYSIVQLAGSKGLGIDRESYKKIILGIRIPHHSFLACRGRWLPSLAYPCSLLSRLPSLP